MFVSGFHVTLPEEVSGRVRPRLEELGVGIVFGKE